MIDINKSRSSFQKFPTLKQKCKPIVLLPNKTNSINKAAAATTAAAVAAAAVVAAKATATTTSATAATTTTSNIINKTTINNRSNLITTTATTTRTKELHNKKLLQATSTIPTTTTTTSTSTTKTNNIGRATNQNFFLVSNYKDQNFLKEECELAQAQLSSPKKQLKTFIGEDNRNNNNLNININLQKQKNVHCQQSIVTLQLPTITTANGMRQSGHGNYMANNKTTNTTSTYTTTTTKITTPISSTTATGISATSATTKTTVHKIEQQNNTNINQYKILPKTNNKNNITSNTNINTINTTNTTNTLYTTTKLNNRQVRPLVHRSIPTTTIAAVNAIENNNNINNNNNNTNNNNNSSNNNNHNNNNNMQQDDDIKYIDSDEVVVATTATSSSNTTSSNTHTKNPRIRPKSTIICSATNLVFEKVNNYKFGVGNNEINRRGIDCGSIKASIDKFNSFSEQKRLPTATVTLRSHAGSINNLQHRHSSDFENCNVRLTAGSGGNNNSGSSSSLTRTPYRSNALPTGKVITSLHSTAATVRASTLSNSLPNKCRNSQQLERVCASSLNIKESCNNVSSSPMYKLTILKQTQQAAAAAAAAAATAAATPTTTTSTSTGITTTTITEHKAVENALEVQAVKKNLSETEDSVS